MLKLPQHATRSGLGGRTRRPHRYRRALGTAKRISNPGCYATCAPPSAATPPTWWGYPHRRGGGTPTGVVGVPPGTPTGVVGYPHRRAGMQLALLPLAEFLRGPPSCFGVSGCGVAYAHALKHARAGTRTRRYTHRQPHAREHAHARARARARAHTHTQKGPGLSGNRRSASRAKWEPA
jgi:hypothetical protein